MTKEEQFECLRQVLKDNKVKYWADFGTLLGLTRDGELVKNDGDIDLGLWDDQIDNLENIKKIITEKGYVLKKSIYKNYTYPYSFKNLNKVLRKLYKNSENINVDKLPYSLNYDLVTWLIEKKFVEELEYEEKYKVFVPKITDKYVTLHYGNWRVPSKVWNYSEYDGALKKGKPELYLEI
jgi:lipopolysaccharide cholinephosphotransferase